MPMLYIMPDDLACYVVKLPLESVPNGEKISVRLRPMSCPWPKDTETTRTIGRTQDGFAKYEYTCEKFSCNFHRSETS